MLKGLIKEVVITENVQQADPRMYTHLLLGAQQTETHNLHMQNC